MFEYISLQWFWQADGRKYLQMKQLIRINLKMYKQLMELSIERKR